MSVTLSNISFILWSPPKDERITEILRELIGSFRQNAKHTFPILDLIRSDFSLRSHSIPLASECGLDSGFRSSSVVSQTSQHDLSQYRGVAKRTPDCVYFPRLHSTQHSFFETRRRQRYVDRGMRKKRSIAFPSQRGSEG